MYKLPSPALGFPAVSLLAGRPLRDLPIPPRSPEPQQTTDGQKTQSRGDGLARPQRAGYAGRGQYGAGEQSQLDTVALALGDAVAARGVEGADAAPGDEGGDGARADVAHGAAAGDEAGEDEGDCAARVSGGDVGDGKGGKVLEGLVRLVMRWVLDFGE